MTWFLIALVVAYFIGVRVVARRYFVRRHGVSLEKGEKGMTEALAIAAIWPVTIFVDSVKNPTRCNHHRHILQNNRIMSEINQITDMKRNRG
jgi:hypothetical protein